MAPTTAPQQVVGHGLICYDHSCHSSTVVFFADDHESGFLIAGAFLLTSSYARAAIGFRKVPVISWNIINEHLSMLYKLNKRIKLVAFTTQALYKPILVSQIRQTDRGPSGIKEYEY